MERTPRPSQRQLELLLEFLEEQPKLAKGFSKVAAARENAHQVWSTLALKLNSMGGCVKSPKKWIKYWNDKKSAVKKKAATRNAQRQQTGGDVGEIVDLTICEERIVALMSDEGDVQGDSSLKIKSFPLRSNTPPFQIADKSSTPNIIENENKSEIIQIYIDPFNMMDNTVESFTNPLDTCRPGIKSQPIPDPQQPSPQGSTSSCRRHRETRCTVPQVKRRLLLRSPLSHRRNSLTSTADKFFKLEERRLEVEEKIYSLISEGQKAIPEGQKAIAEGQKAIAEGQRAIAEGLKAIAEVLNR